MSDYSFEGPVWRNAGNVVTWAFADAGGSFTNAITGACQNLVTEALAAWSAVANVTFRQVADGRATNVRIGWGDVTLPTIGETYYHYSTNAATGTSTFLNGVVVEAEDPALHALVGSGDDSTYANTACNLLQVLTHEIGHALGLDHSTQATAVMNAYSTAADHAISAYDVAGIQALYGANPDYVAPPTDDPATQTAGVTPATLGMPMLNPVYRFFDSVHGTQLLTASTDEMNMLVMTRRDLSYEGVAMDAANRDDATAVPVYRFFETTDGTHFMTASATERDAVAATRPDMTAEGVAFYGHSARQAGDVAVYRYFEQTNGTHFMTTSEDERATLAATRPDMTYEGIAFWMPST